MVEAQHPAEPLGALDRAECRLGAACRLDQPIIDSLMVPLPVIMSGVLASGPSQRPFAEEDHSIPKALEGVSDLQISPDGRWIYFTERSSEGDIWIGRFEG